MTITQVQKIDISKSRYKKVHGRVLLGDSLTSRERGNHMPLFYKKICCRSLLLTSFTQIVILINLIISDVDECKRKAYYCDQFTTECANERGSYSCGKCKRGYIKDGLGCYYAKSCSVIRKDARSVSGNYFVDPDGRRGLQPFAVYCDMTNKNGVGLTVISHDSERRTHVSGYGNQGSYSRDIHYKGASLPQLASLTRVSSHCEQFIKYECHNSVLLYNNNPYGWWVSRDSIKMTYWGGASRSGKCTCGMTNSCADSRFGCNCDKNDNVWREDSGPLTDKTRLPVKQLRFGDTGGSIEQGYHTLGKLKCYGIA